MVPERGLEPPTNCLRSNFLYQLGYSGALRDYIRIASHQTPKMISTSLLFRIEIFTPSNSIGKSPSYTIFSIARI